ncbi:DUF7507 domain-containing protein [Parafrankia sp. FMc2]|uniref:DUF7507 domain-containing protein n=1 Tax=Parafrankia sp. FMc2 TaxID=3233196 RepID=UPI0034D4C36F
MSCEQIPRFFSRDPAKMVASVAKRMTVRGLTVVMVFGAVFSAASAAFAQAEPIFFFKTPSQLEFNGAGEVITYTYRFFNGPSWVVGVSVTDDHLGPVSCPSTSMPPGGSMDCVGQYTTTEADVAAGRIVNIALAIMKDTSGERYIKIATAAVVHRAAIPTLTLATIQSPFTFSTPGQTISYTYRLINGPVGLKNVSVVDDRIGMVHCPLRSLPPGSVLDCAAQYTTTVADALAGSTTSSATVTATTLTGVPVSRTGSATVAYRSPLGLGRTASPRQFTGPGQVITYRYAVSNNSIPSPGLVNILVIDNRLGPIFCPGSSLGPQGFMECTAQYTTTAADVLAGSVVSTAIATANAPGGEIVGAQGNAVTYYAEPA